MAEGLGNGFCSRRPQLRFLHVFGGTGVWRRERRNRLQELRDAHRLVGGTGRGRRWRTTQLDAALLVRLAVEFQGFGRDLHDLASTEFAQRAAISNRQLEETIRTALVQGRQLDRQNAHPGSLGSDFNRLGMDVWSALEQLDPETPRHNVALDSLNTLRNALVHDQTGKLEELEKVGMRITLRTYVGLLKPLDQLAGNLDCVVADHLGQLFGKQPPW